MNKSEQNRLIREDIEALISSRTEESLNLEYKRAAALDKEDKQKNEISKDVSAMANSAGGKILYGVKKI